ncbi:hypothetical protein [Fluviicola chungangensis]|uniref:Uncharacterized protein n=1 Tax=Fluviicola chungangensis TaxID=2597671 RepID=A0A556N3P3_9FLAO|nr:hypothetical protein [Fluviicola chungangensis]TSJ46653.1 hypothetical protein FO442_05700 [Fluviicola chungangensis]
MKKRIHIDNYESFYLDYLEGTLSEEERIAFEEFLAANPELQVDEELLFLDDVPETMDPLQKCLLKKEDLSIVTPENLDYFAIGKVEQVLSAHEEKLFDTYLIANPEAQQVLAAYRETRLQATPVVYPNKEDLKEKEVALVSWKFIARAVAVAAILLLFFQLGFNNGKEASHNQNNTVASNDKTKHHTKPDSKKPAKVVPSIESIGENNTYVAQKNTPKANATSKTDKRPDLNQKEKKDPVQLIPNQPQEDKNNVADNKPQPHHPTILPQVKDDKQPVAPTLNEDVNKAPSKDLASNTGGSNMKNPIPLITNTLSEKTKTPVDFQTGKATETQKGGFFVKIGKFEISHKSSKKK